MASNEDRWAPARHAYNDLCSRYPIPLQLQCKAGCPEKLIGSRQKLSGNAASHVLIDVKGIRLHFTLLCVPQTRAGAPFHFRYVTLVRP